MPHGLCGGGGQDNCPVLCSDGQVIEPGGSMWETISAWQRDAGERWTEPQPGAPGHD
jgi:hypothetical protein